MRLEDLLRRVPKDVQDAVDDTYRRHGQVVRNLMRDETRLRLQAPYIRTPSREDGSLPVTVEDSHRRLNGIELPKEATVSALLAPWKPALRALAASGAKVEEMMGALGSVLELAGPFELLRGAPRDAARLAQELLKRAEAFDLVAHISNCDEDVLGVYSLKSAPSIRLYRSVIGLVAQCLGVSVEGLTIVVLAHELAHGFTHLGYDSDGERGNPEWFRNLEHPAREGLAQFYAARVARSMDGRVPGTLHAYETLLPAQQPAYQGHKRWLINATPESVRGALLLARRMLVLDYEAFDRLVSTESERMKRTPLFPGEGDR